MIRFLVTYAQNGADVHEGFLASCKHWCKRNDGVLLAHAGVYAERKHGTEYDPLLRPYLHKGGFTYNRNLLHVDTRALPTARYPLSGMAVYAGKYSLVVPSPKVQRIDLPGPKGIRIFMSTGAITRPKYLPSHSGQHAELNHVIGALVVEVDENKGLYHLRSVHADSDGSFFDLSRMYTPRGVSRKIVRPAALVLGDVHAAQLSIGEAYSCGRRLTGKIKPESLVVHDLHDHASRSHHDENPRAGRPFGGSVLSELEHTVSVLEALAEGSKLDPIVVPSNHDGHLDRWLSEGKYDGVRDEWIWLNQISQEGIGGNALESYFHKMGVPFRSAREVWNIGKFIVAYHGDRGQGGSRGSLGQFAKAGGRYVVGHSHRAGVEDGAVQVGVLPPSDRFGYARNQLSAWSETHAVISPEGDHCSLITPIDGQFTTLKP